MVEKCLSFSQRELRIVVLFVLFLAGSARAEGESSQNASSFSWLNFQAGPALAFQGSGSSVSGVGRFLPKYQLQSAGSDHGAAIGLDLGLSSFNSTGQSAFLVYEYGLFGAYRLNAAWEARLFAGGQSWGSGNGTAAFAGPQALWHPGFSTLPWVDHFYVSYSAVFQATMAHEVGIGVGLGF
jgi:hypothetical protein